MPIGAIVLFFMLRSDRDELPAGVPIVFQAVQRRQGGGWECAVSRWERGTALPAPGGTFDAMPRTTVSERIAVLDPDVDHQEIVRLLGMYVFPWDFERALELALFRTYAVPSISRLLAETGEFLTRPQKRYDDTSLIMAEIAEHGYDSDRGRRALRRMNQMHRRFAIANEDYLYVLSTFVFEPIRWAGRYGRRPVTAAEQHAIFRFYQEVGRRMNIRDIPTTIGEFEVFNRRYEAEHFVLAETNRLIGIATVDLFLGFYLPRPLWPIGRPVVHALLDDNLLAAFGFPRPSDRVRKYVAAALEARRRILGAMPERRRPVVATERNRPTYPEGHRIEELGTFD